MYTFFCFPVRDERSALGGMVWSPLNPEDPCLNWCKAHLWKQSKTLLAKILVYWPTFRLQHSFHCISLTELSFFSFRMAWISCTVLPRGVTSVFWSILWKIWKTCSLIKSTRWESLVLPQCPWSWSVMSFITQNCTLSSLLQTRAQTKFRDRMGFVFQCIVTTRTS